MAQVTQEGGHYWEQYTGIQHAKHQILSWYLDAWYPVMAKYNRRLLYIDTHAGRGRHDTGEKGSPLIAIERLLQHNSRSTILRRAEVTYLLLERNASCLTTLKNEIAALGDLPPGVRVHPLSADYETVVQHLLSNAESQNTHLVPTFAFVDPFSFRLSMSFLNRLLSQDKCELLVTFMYRHASLAAAHSSQAHHLDELFGCTTWRSTVTIDDPDLRASQFVDLFGRQLHAKHVTWLAMRDNHNVLKYFLIHATNHDLGRDKMKEAMWRAVPDGSFTAYQNTNPAQLVLMTIEPDLRPLRDRLLASFGGRTVRMRRLDQWLLGELYLAKHLHTVIEQWRRDGVITASDYGETEGRRFSFRSNPLLTFQPVRS